MMKTVNILGTPYSFKVDDLNNPELGEMMVFAECLTKKSSSEQRNIWVEFLKSQSKEERIMLSDMN